MRAAIARYGSPTCRNRKACSRRSSVRRCCGRVNPWRLMVSPLCVRTLSMCASVAAHGAHDDSAPRGGGFRAAQNCLFERTHGVVAWRAFRSQKPREGSGVVVVYTAQGTRAPSGDLDTGEMDGNRSHTLGQHNAARHCPAASYLPCPMGVGMMLAICTAASDNEKPVR